MSKESIQNDNDYKELYLSWKSVYNACPKSWLLRMENGQPHTEYSAKSHIQIDSHIKEIAKLTNKEVYWMLLTRKIEKPKAQIKLELNNPNTLGLWYVLIFIAVFLISILDSFSID